MGHVIIIIIIIIIIINHFCTGYIFTWNKPFFCGIYCCSCSVAAIYDTNNIMSDGKHVVILYYFFTNYVFSVHCDCFLWFLDVVHSRYVAQLLREKFWGSSNLPLLFLVTLFCIPYRLYFYYRDFIFYSIICPVFENISLPWSSIVYNRHVLFPSQRTVISALLLWMIVSVFTCWLHNMIILLTSIVSNN